MFRHLSAIRHGRGFGVHSPLAFELITVVLPDRPAYYADAFISKKPFSKREQRIGRIVVRLIARFQPRAIHCPECFKDIATLADSRIKFVVHDDEAPMSIVRDGNNNYKIRVGFPGTDKGPIVLDNKRNLRIEVYRSGLSPTEINTTL